jgi:hypothetical protein
MVKLNSQYYWYLLGTSTFLLVFVSLQFFIPISISMADSPSQSIELPNENSDPTMSRAAKFIGKKVPEAVTHYNQLRETFMKNLKREDIKYFNMWISGVMNPLFVAAWEKEWRDYPESHPAFALYIRDQIKTSQELRKILDPNLDDETLFKNYLKHNEKYAEENLRKQAELEEKIGGIPEDLKVAIRNPGSYSFVSTIYYHYDNVQSVSKLMKQRQKQQEAEIARRKAIVPVDRNSKEYQSAFDSYKKAIEEENQAVGTAQHDDPAWIRAKYLLETKNLGTVPSVNTQEKIFLQELDNVKRDQYHQWKKSFDVVTSINTIEQEWKKEPDSHPAILFVVNVMLERMKLKNEGKTFNSAMIDQKEMIKGDKTSVEQYFSFLKQNDSVSLAQMESLEKDLRIPNKLKEELKTNIINSTLFLFYETYFREFTPDKVKGAKQKVADAITKLNNLRPNWAIEEKIEFPDKFSWKMHQLGLDVEKPYWTWQRIIVLSSLLLVILLVIVFKIRNRLKKNKKQE